MESCTECRNMQPARRRGCAGLSTFAFPCLSIMHTVFASKAISSINQFKWSCENTHYPRLSVVNSVGRKLFAGLTDVSPNKKTASANTQRRVLTRRADWVAILTAGIVESGARTDGRQGWRPATHIRVPIMHHNWLIYWSLSAYKRCGGICLSTMVHTYSCTPPIRTRSLTHTHNNGPASSLRRGTKHNILRGRKHDRGAK